MPISLKYFSGYGGQIGKTRRKKIEEQEGDILNE